MSLGDGDYSSSHRTKRAGSQPRRFSGRKKIAYVGFDDKVQTYQVASLYVMNRDGSAKRVVTSDLDRSVSSPVGMRKGRESTFSMMMRVIRSSAMPLWTERSDVLAESLGGGSLGRPYGGGSFSVATDGCFAFMMTRPEHPADVAVGRMLEKSIDRLTDLNGDLLGFRDLGKVEEIWYESSFDQRKIQGWIVTPPDFDPSKKYPLILEIHGGPIS